MPSLVSLTYASLLAKTQTRVFVISGFLANPLCKDIDMKLGLVTKIDKANTEMLKRCDEDVMSANCDVVVIFLIYGQFGAIWMPDCERMVCNNYIFISSNLLYYKD